MLTLARCSAEVVGVDASALGDQTLDDVRARITYTAWLPVDSAVRVVVVERRPRLKDRSGADRAIEAHYPPSLRKRGVRGRTRFIVLIDEEGRLVRHLVRRGARHPEFNFAASDVLTQLEFYPATYGNCRVPFWTELEVAFGGRFEEP